MKNFAVILFSAVFTLPVILFPVCAGGAPAQEAGTTFKTVEGREWILSEVKNAGKTVTVDRKKLEADDMGGFFTIVFQAEKASGTGAPNRFSGPYTAGFNRALTIGLIASTRMAALREPDGIKENEYFAYLAKVIRWDLKEGKLELYGSNGDGTETIMIFEPK